LGHRKGEGTATQTAGKEDLLDGVKMTTTTRRRTVTMKRRSRSGRWGDLDHHSREGVARAWLYLGTMLAAGGVKGLPERGLVGGWVLRAAGVAGPRRSGGGRSTRMATAMALEAMMTTTMTRTTEWTRTNHRSDGCRAVESWTYAQACVKQGQGQQKVPGRIWRPAL
jgi:hypothetical protein